MATLYATSTAFFSRGDEAAFDYWLSRIPAVSSIRFVTATLEIDIAEPVSDDDLRELIAFFYRYYIDMQQLGALEGPTRRPWFRKRAVYWRDYVFGKRRRRDDLGSDEE